MCHLIRQYLSVCVCLFSKIACVYMRVGLHFSDVCDPDHPACPNEIWAGQDCHSGVAHYKGGCDGKMKNRGRAYAHY